MSPAADRARTLLAHGRDLPDALGRRSGHEAADALQQLEALTEQTAELMDVNRQLVPLLAEFRRPGGRGGWWRWFTGEQLEQDVFFHELRRRIETLAEVGQRAHPALRRQSARLRQFDELLATELSCLDDDLAAARHLLTPDGRQAARAAGLDDEDLARLGRRVANLESLATATQLTRAQYQLAAQHAREAADRFREIRTLLLPVWKQAVGFDLFARRVADAPSDPGVAR